MREPFNDPVVRRALNYAIDKQAIVDGLFDGVFTVADAPIVPLLAGEETLGSATSDEFQIVAYRDWPNRSRWTFYAGAGVAVSRTRQDFSWLWARSADPADIATGLGQPNAPEIRRNLAGTVSLGRRTLRDTMVGYVLIAGIDRNLSERVSVGL